MARAVCIAFAGGNDCGTESNVGHPHRRLGTYQVHTIAEGGSGSKNAQNCYGILDGFHDSIASFKITEFSCLALKDSGNGLDGVTIVDLLGKWMFSQCYTGRFFIVLQGRLEKLSKTRRSRLACHI